MYFANEMLLSFSANGVMQILFWRKKSKPGASPSLLFPLPQVFWDMNFKNVMDSSFHLWKLSNMWTGIVKMLDYCNPDNVTLFKKLLILLISWKRMNLWKTKFSYLSDEWPEESTCRFHLGFTKTLIRIYFLNFPAYLCAVCFIGGLAVLVRMNKGC